MQENRLPQTKREGLLYGSIIAGITSLLMATFNISLSFGTINGQILLNILYSWPLFFVIAMLLENFVAGPFAIFMCKKFGGETDGFNARIWFRIIFTVTAMSFLMTFVGLLWGEILSGSVTTKIFSDFLIAWPRNFFVVFWIETLIAQPIARACMKKLHTSKQAKIVEFTQNEKNCASEPSKAKAKVQNQNKM